MTTGIRFFVFGYFSLIASAALGETVLELARWHDAVSLNLCSMKSNKCVTHSHITLNTIQTFVGDIVTIENLDDYSFIGSFTVDRIGLSPDRSSCQIIGRETNTTYMVMVSGCVE